MFGLIFDKKLFRSFYFTKSNIGWYWLLRATINKYVFKINENAKFPVSSGNRIDNPDNVFFDYDDLQNFQHFGCYFSNVNNGEIHIGKGTVIAPNVGIITTNHCQKNIRAHLKPKNVKIGKNCWIGMNVMILPGVVLGNNTNVGAGSVVTKSFPLGNTTIAGNPAKVI